jgi:hypothetical protein
MTANGLISLNGLLKAAGYDPARVRYLRHKEPAAARGRTVYELWRDDRSAFDEYQTQQGEIARRLRPDLPANQRALHWLRDRSDSQVSILEVASSSQSAEDIIALESIWKNKLQTRAMGLNSN